MNDMNIYPDDAEELYDLLSALHKALYGTDDDRSDAEDAYRYYTSDM